MLRQRSTQAREVGTWPPASKFTRMREATEQMIHYPPGMDARSTRVAEFLNTPMLIAAALTLPMVAISESHPGGGLEDVARLLNWVTWSAFAIELAVMLAVVPNRWLWL